MSTLGDRIRLRRQIAAVAGGGEPARRTFVATMGDVAGNVHVAGQPNYVYITQTGRSTIRKALNVRVRPEAGLSVVCGYTAENPTVLQVLEVDWGGNPDPGDLSYLLAHHLSHELGGGDEVWLAKEQITALAPYPTNPVSNQIHVQADFYAYGTTLNYWPGGLTIDFITFLPTYLPTAHHGVYVTVSIDGATNLLQYTAGVEFPSWPPPPVGAAIPAPPLGSVPIAAVYLVAGHNLLPNDPGLLTDSFEVPGAGGPDIWANWTEFVGVGALANDAVIFYAAGGGLNSCQTTEGGGGSDTGVYQDFVVTPGANYQLRFWTRDDGGANDGQYRIYDVTNAADIVAITGTGVVGGPAWVEVTQVFTAPAGCVSARVYFYCPGAGAAQAWFDDVTVASVPNSLNWNEIRDIRQISSPMGGSVAPMAHDILSASHSDTTPAVVVRGDLMTGQGVAPLWVRLAHPGALYHFQTDANDVGWLQDIIMADDSHIGGIGLLDGRIIFDYTPAPDEIHIADATLVMDTSHILPAGAGQDLGSGIARWDVFAEYVDLPSAVGWIGNSAATARLMFDSSGAVDFAYFMGCYVGVNIAAPLGYVHISDQTIDTTNAVFGLFANLVKTDGVTDAADHLYGNYAHIELDQVGGTVGHIIGLGGQARGSAGTVALNVMGVLFSASLQGATVTGDAVGIYAAVDGDQGSVANVKGLDILVDLEAAMAGISGSVYGALITVDADEDPAGSAYMLYLSEGTNIDYGIYQSGSAPNVLGGYLGVGIVPTVALHLYHATNSVYQYIETDLVNGEAMAYFINDAQNWRIGTTGGDLFTIRDATAGVNVVTIEPGADVNSIYVDADGHVGHGGDPGIQQHIHVVDVTVDTTAAYYGFRCLHTRTGGATDHADAMTGVYIQTTYNNNGVDLGHFRGMHNVLTLTDGDIGNVNLRNMQGFNNSSVLNGGTVTGALHATYNYAIVQGTTVDGNVHGIYNYLNLDSGTVSGAAIGILSRVDDDLGVTGTVYNLYLDNDTGVDYAIYSDGTAPCYFAGNVGIGTATIPHGGVGWAKLAIDGTVISSAGPHIQCTVSTDSYPTFQLLNYSHDSVHMVFDAYFDGGWKSSDAGSSFAITKRVDTLAIRYDIAAAGGAVVWNDGIILDTSGDVTIPALAGVGVRAVVAAADGTLSAP